MPAFTREERARQRADQNRELARFHRQLDLMAQDTRHKFERPSFAVVTASAAYRHGWDRIFRKEPHVGDA